MSSRGRSLEKTSSKRSGQSKSTGRSVSESNKPDGRSGRSLPRQQSKESSPKRRPQSASSRSKDKSIDRSLVLRKKSKQKEIALKNDNCGCGPDFYTNLLGPTADETILVGLQTFMAFCQECPDKSDSVDSGTGISTKESSSLSAALPEPEPDPPKEPSAKSVSIKEDPPVPPPPPSREPSPIPEPDPPEEEEVEEEEEYFSPQISVARQTSPTPSSSHKSQTEQPEVADDVSQTDSTSEVSGSQTSQHSLSNAESQTRQPSVKASASQAKYYRSVTSQNNEESLKTSEVQVCKGECSDKGEQSVERRSEKSQAKLPSASTYDSSTSSSRLKGSSCSCCCPCGNTTTSSSESPGTKSCSCPSSKVKLQQKPGGRRSCLKGVTKCKCATSVTSAKSNSFVSVPQKRRVRVCCDCDPTSSLTASEIDAKESEKSLPSEMGDNNVGVKVRYAITKITKFYSYTTFEVMRSTRKKPKVMPKNLEGVFVMRNKAVKCTRSPAAAVS